MEQMDQEPTSSNYKSSLFHDPHQIGRAPRLTVSLAILLTGIIYFFLPDKLTVGPDWLLLAIELVLIVPLWIFWLTGHALSYRTARTISYILLGLVTVALAIGVTFLIIDLPAYTSGFRLLRSAGLLWVFNILVFAFWYWEIDGGGPRQRHEAGHRAADFMFPQQVEGKNVNWGAGFFDYLFVAFTGATAFSPTDTYPLTRRAKALMMVEGLLSLAIVVILVGRVANIF
jgi:hypothetical protein